MRAEGIDAPGMADACKGSRVSRGKSVGGMGVGVQVPWSS